MTKNQKNVWGGIGILAVIALVFAFSHSAGKSHTSVRVAANLPLTGPVAAYSGQYPNGFRMGLEEASSKYNTNPSNVSVDFQDNAGMATNSATVFQNQRLNNPTVYISGTSEAAIAIAKQVDTLGIPNFLVAFDPFLAREGHNRLRILPNSKIEGPLFVQYATSRAAKKVFILNLNSAYANSEVDDIITPGLRSAGIDYQREQYEFGLRDFKNLALKVRAYSPDLIFTIGYSFHLKPLLRDLRAAGLVHDGSVMAAMDFVDMLYDGTPKAELAGIAFACPIFEVKGAVADADPWRARYKQKFGRQPTYVEAYAYDTAGIIVKTFSQAGQVTTQSIRSSLPYAGITGNINLDQDGDIIATVTTARLDDSGAVTQIASAEHP